MNIRKLEQRDTEKAIYTLVEAFQDDPLYVHFVSNANKRIDFLKKFMLFRLRYGMKYGEVYSIADAKGIAIWLPPEKSMSFFDVVSLGGLHAMVRQGKKTMSTVMAFNKLSDDLLKTSAPGSHWTISPIAVSPELQGRRYGSTLLQHGLERLDNIHASCVLETQTRKNELFYSKYAFNTVSISTIPHTSLETLVMLRTEK